MFQAITNSTSTLSELSISNPNKRQNPFRKFDLSIITKIAKYLETFDMLTFVSTYKMFETFSHLKILIDAYDVLQIDNDSFWPVLVIHNHPDRFASLPISKISNLYQKILVYGLDQLQMLQDCTMQSKVHLILNDEYLNNEGMCYLSQFTKLNAFENITKLQLINNGIDDITIKSLAKSLHYSKLTHLMIVKNDIGPEGIYLICKGVKKSKISYLQLVF
jgi:hypothetical protein